MKIANNITASFAAALLATSFSTPALATGKMKCEAGPQSGWTSIADLEAHLVKKGWTIKKSKVDGGCYEVYGTTPEGDHVEAYFHPVTMEKLLVSRRGKILFRK